MKTSRDGALSGAFVKGTRTRWITSFSPFSLSFPFSPSSPSVDVKWKYEIIGVVVHQTN